MTNKEFKKAVITNKKIDELVQPKSFLKKVNSKDWDIYSEEIREQKENFEQVLYSVAIEPSLKEAIQVAGKNRGRTKGGAKSVMRDALSSYFKKHPELFE